MKSSSSTMRLFVALPLTASAQNSLIVFCRRLKDRAPDARWVVADSMHITLFFLGETEQERISQVSESLEQVHSQPLELKIESIGGFDRAGIFFAAVRPSHRLLQLAESVREKISALGLASKESVYRPHITLARTKRGLKPLLTMAQDESFPSIGFSVDRFLLYRSHLTKEGSHYEVLKEFPL